MSMFNDTITIYNKYTEGGAERWQRTALKGVYWNANKGAVLRKAGAAPTDSATIIIPRNIAAGRGYLRPMEWEGRADKRGAWTLQAGDTVVKGCVSVDIQRSIAKELSGLDDVLTITNVDNNDFGGDMAHWEVSGK